MTNDTGEKVDRSEFLRERRTISVVYAFIFFFMLWQMLEWRLARNSIDHLKFKTDGMTDRLESLEKQVKDLSEGKGQ